MPQPTYLYLKDDLGRTVRVKAPVRRVLSLAPAIAENLAAVGGLSFLVGVTTVDNFPPEVSKIPRIGDFGAPAYERILALKPDLAIVEIGKVDRATVENAERRMRCPIFVQISKRYEDVPRHLRQLGDVIGAERRADAVAREMQETLQAIKRRTAGQAKPTVFVEVSREPLYTAGPGSFIDDLIRLAGGMNIVKGDNPYPVFSREALLAANPEHYIIAVGGDMSKADTTLPSPLNRIAAVKEGHIHAIPADYLFRPTPRLAKGLEALAKALHS
jgi:iron complex transport system substrate-binding protein